MTNTYKMLTLIGTSSESYEAAINNAISDASASVRNLSWFEVVEMRGRINGSQVAEFQVKVNVGFKVEVS